MPSALLVFAHPDDETIAVGARLSRFRNAHLVHVTDGAPRNEHDSRAHGFACWQDYRDARARELANALRTAGAGDMSRECLGFADQEATLHLAEIAEALADRFRQLRPAVVFTHPYEGGHPDHDACAFAAHHAAALLQREGIVPPLLVEAPFYHAAESAAESAFAIGRFLPAPEHTDEVAFALMCRELDEKRAALACFTTQQETLHGFERLDWERFRVAPAYTFTRPPLAPRVLYESFPWGMTSARFCELAADARRALQPELAIAC